MTFGDFDISSLARYLHLAPQQVAKLAALIRGGDLRLLLLAAGFEDFVPVIPDLVAQTEEERHRLRVREASAIT